MKRSILIFIFVASICNVFSQTQSEMNQSASVEYQKADKELNRVYGLLTKKIDATQKSALIEAEKAWLKYRDLHCKFECMDNEGGSMYPMLYSGCMTELTNKRTLELKTILDSK